MTLSRQSVGRNLSGHELTRNSSGNTRLQSSQLAEPLWTDPGLKSGISLRELISTLKKKEKKAQAGNERMNILPKFSHAKKKPPPPPPPPPINRNKSSRHFKQNPSLELFLLLNPLDNKFDVTILPQRWR